MRNLASISLIMLFSSPAVMAGESELPLMGGEGLAIEQLSPTLVAAPGKMLLTGDTLEVAVTVQEELMYCNQKKCKSRAAEAKADAKLGN